MGCCVLIEQRIAPFLISRVVEVYQTMLEAVEASVKLFCEEMKHQLYESKIAYFKILFNNEIVKEMHSFKSKNYGLEHSSSSSTL